MSGRPAGAVERALEALLEGEANSPFRFSGSPASRDDASVRRWAIAFSGGLDSTVLLHAAARFFGPDAVIAIHVHHGLQAAADAWPAHCRAQAESLGVAFEFVRLQGPPPRGANVEAWAREQRYQALSRVALAAGATAVLTAHHQDDQFETVLMRMARGTGVDGLSGIEPSLRMHGCDVARPFLVLPRTALRAWAQANALAWIEDPTNEDARRTRNVVRHQVLPQLEACEPGFRVNLAASVAKARQLRAERRELAQRDLARAGVDAPGGFDRAALMLLPARRCDLALREWVRSLGLRVPTAARLREMRRQLIEGDGAHGRVRHEGHWLVRDRDRVHAVPAGVLDDGPAEPLAAPQPLAWSGEASIALARWQGRLEFLPAPKSDAIAVSARWLRSQPLSVADGGASSLRLRPAPGGRRRTLKNLYQERGIAAWRRPGLPLVFAGDELVYASGVGMHCLEIAADEGDRVVLRWVPE